MNIKDTIATINQMQADGVIRRYAIGGAVGATLSFKMSSCATDSQPPGDDLNNNSWAQRMTFDLTKIMQSKREFRQRLAAKPIEEKLAMLNALRAQAMTLRGSRTVPQPGTLHEQPPAYRTRPKQAE